MIIGGAGDDNILEGFGISHLGLSWWRSITVENGVTVRQVFYAVDADYAWEDTPDGNDVIYGGAGDDWISSGGGNDIVDAGADNDVVWAGAGSDVVFGGGGHDVLMGDFVKTGTPPASLHGDDYINGGDGNDELWGNGGADHLEGGIGNDTLYGDGEVSPEYEGDDILDGGPGADKLYGGGGNDTYLNVDAGDLIGDIQGFSDIRLADANGVSTTLLPSVATTNDATLIIPLDNGATLQLQAALYGMSASIQFANGEAFDLESWVSENLAQSVVLNLANVQNASGAPVTRAYGGAGSDQIWGAGTDDVLKGYGGDDQIVGGGGNDLLDGGAGNDHLQGDAGDDVLRGGDGNDTLLGLDGDDSLFGDAGNDELQGGAGSDMLDGGSGDDTLFGQADNDVLDGGAGNDVLVGNGGDDIYHFNLGGGHDVIWEEGDSAGDVLRFGEGISAADITVSQSGTSLMLSHANGVDQVTISNWYAASSFRLARFEFADGTVWTGVAAGNMGLLNLRGTEGNDTITGGSLNESLYGLGGNDYLYGNSGNDLLMGGAGDDWLYGNNGDDLLVGGAGNDWMTGQTGADTYLFALGDGADVIQGDTNDVLRFASDIKRSDISVERVGNDLMLRHQNGTDSVKVSNWYTIPGARLSQVVFNSDGVTWSTSELSLMGTNYNNSYVFNAGDGARVIEEWGGEDSLTFGEGIAAADVSASRVGTSLLLKVANSADQITFTGWFAYADGSARIEEIRFPDGTVWGAAELTEAALTVLGTDGNDSLYGAFGLNDRLFGLGGNDYLTGYSGDDLIDGGSGYDYLYGGDGNDTLIAGPDGGQASGGAGDDLYLYDLGTGNLTIIEESGSDTVRFGDGITISDVSFSNQDSTLYINVAGAGDIAVNTWFWVNDYGGIVERFEFSDGTVVTSEQINAALLVQNGTADNDSLDGTSLDDTLNGGAGDDRLRGYAGNDSLHGDEGADVSYGGTGDDDLFGGAGDDRLYGEDGHDSLTGGAGNDYLAGGSGNDVYLELGRGNDRVIDSSGVDSAYFASEISAADLILSRQGADLMVGFNGRADTVTFQEWFRQSGVIENFVFADGGSLSASDMHAMFNVVNGNGNVIGTSGDDMLYGGAGADTLQGGVGNDFLDGGAGADSLVGGPGDDTYVAGANDTIIEQPGEGVDTLVWTDSTAVVLQSALENLVLAESAGSRATGNAANNHIVGNSQGNVLDGGAGADILEGGDGNDTYYVDNVGDVIIEHANEGTNDSVYASVSYSLPQYVESLALTGSAAISGHGNDLDNWLSGNNADNTLVGGAGNDVLAGDLGVDTLIGGEGDDTYYLDGFRDILIEDANSGYDRIVINQVSEANGDVWYEGTYTMQANFESLALTGYVSNAIIYGNAQDNVIDTRNARVAYTKSGGQVTSYYYALVDLYGGAGDDVLYGADGGGVLDGGTGNDIMVGGRGSDDYYVDSVLDQVVEDAAFDSWDDVYSSVSYVLGQGLEGLYLLGTVDINGTGNEGYNILKGNSGANILIGGGGNDTLDGGGGNDTLIGGTGDDTYTVSAGTVVIEQAGEGIDTVRSSLTYVLGAHVENLVLTGSAAINGQGNESDNRIEGNSANNKLEGGAGNDTLDGASGNDTMIGGTGDDVYYVDSSKDVVTELLGEGTDTVFSYVSYTLGANVENVTLLGSSRINGTGNALANVIIGNYGNNTLTGGAGNDWLDGGGGTDKLAGGTGDDTYIVNDVNTTITERSNEGIDRVLSSVTHTLASNVENLALTGTSAINGTGNALNNELTGNSAANTLSGASGNDVLDGGAGDDVLIGGTGNDRYIFGRGYGVDTVAENDTTSGNTDIASFLAGISADQIWFGKAANNLEVSLIGTGDRLVIKDWYLGTAYRVEAFKTADDSKTLLAGQVENLVSAMASFAPPAAGQTTLPQHYQDALAGVIAANWQ